MRLRLMYEFLFGWATPELATPMFGDTRRELPDEVTREERMLYKALMQGAELFDEPKWRAQAKLELDQLPRQTSYAWREAGLYAMRNEWGPQQIMFACTIPRRRSPATIRRTMALSSYTPMAAG